jgi:hypothetical protein
MTMQIWKKLLPALAVLCMTSTVALAAEMSELAYVEPGGYLSGGVGIDNRQAMRERSKHYNLHLAFAQARTGAYLTGLSVSIHRQGRKEADAHYTDVGPWLYVRLHPGHYRIRAEYRGKTRVLNTDVGARSVNHVMYWP